MSVYAVAKSKSHKFSKRSTQNITLIKGLGVDGDCHNGKYVQHQSMVKTSPAKTPNLRQVHLIELETLAEREVEPGQIGENITTAGIDLLSLGQGTRLHFVPLPSTTGTDAAASTKAPDTKKLLKKSHAVVEVTGLRNPGPQLDKFRKGLREAFLVRDAQGSIVGCTAGIMGVVEEDGPVTEGMWILVEPAEEYYELGCV